MVIGGVQIKRSFYFPKFASETLLIMNIKIGFSPCPNDTFMFNALVNGKLNTQGFEFTPVIADVEALNKMALNGELDVTKLSLNAFAFAAQHYQILNAGCALGYNCGPLLVSKNKFTVDDIAHLKIAIPGKYTTANLLLTIFYPEARNTIEMIFSDIENAVLTGNADAGLLIHENRFTYEQQGLYKILDLGEEWYMQTHKPLPLGCIAVKQSLHSEVKLTIDKLISQSVNYAFENKNQTMPYVKQHAQEMDEQVMMQHINLYVTNASVIMGDDGKATIEYLLQKGFEAKLLPQVNNIFLQNKVTV